MNRTTVKELYNKISKKILHTQILDDISSNKTGDGSSKTGDGSLFYNTLIDN